MKKILFGVSAATLALLYGLLVLILLIIFDLIGVDLIVSLIVSAIFLLLQFLISPFLTDLTQRWFYKTKFGAEVPEYLREFIEEVCREHKMKYPKIGYIDDGAPNAFTYGHTKNDARIVLTRGIFELLTEDEVKAVVAHELGHAVHYDMLLMTVAELVPLVLYGVARGLLEGAKSSTGGDSDDNKAAAAEAAVAAIAYVLYIVAQYIVLWFSRTREYFADEFAVDATGEPEALSRALIQIGFGLSTHADMKAKKEKKSGMGMSASATNAMGIFDTKASKSLVVSCFVNGEIDKTHIKNAMKWELWNTWAKWYELNSTHPLISKRLQAIDKLAPQYGKAPFVEFDLVQPESYFDDFLREIGISIAPVIAFLGAAATGALFYFTEKMSLLWIPAALLILSAILSLLKYRFTHPTKAYHEATVAGLIAEPKVSGIRSIPCELQGTIIGRGDPGCIFSEDFVLQDETGIIFLDYNQPLFILNKIFAIFKAKQNLDRNAVIRGWYRRSPVPYVELYSMEVGGKKKKIFTYGVGKVLRWVYLVLAVAALAAVFVLL